MRSRSTIILWAIVVIALGILSRKSPIGFVLWDKYLGDALYAILLYLCVTCLWPKKSPAWRATVSTITVAAIETFQLTGIPHQLSQSGSTPLNLLSRALGTHFSWLDMLAYIAGIAFVILIAFRKK
jgi:hypothetical protein